MSVPLWFFSVEVGGWEGGNKCYIYMCYIAGFHPKCVCMCGLSVCTCEGREEARLSRYVYSDDAHRNWEEFTTIYVSAHLQRNALILADFGVIPAIPSLRGFSVGDKSMYLMNYS